MEIKVVKQPSWRPTNKLITVATVAPIIYAMFSGDVRALWALAPVVSDYADLMTMVSSTGLAGVLAYLVPDRANVISPQRNPTPTVRSGPKPVRTADEVRAAVAKMRSEGTLPLRDCDKLRLGMPLDIPPQRLPHKTIATVTSKDGKVRIDDDGEFKSIVSGFEAKKDSE